MNVRPARRREGIVALTQTEIMLVLAVIILLLLTAKNADLTAAREQIRQAEASAKLSPETAEEVAEDTEESAADNGEISSADLNEEITDILIAGGATNQKTSETLGASAATSPEQAAAEVGYIARAALALDEEEDAAVVRREIVRLREQSELLAQLRAENATLKATAAQLSRQLAAQESRNDAVQAERNIRDEVGFLPCWTGVNKRRYYFTYRVVYFPARDRFRLMSHDDWHIRAATVDAALSGDLAVLKEYPRGDISRQQFLQFAQTIEAAKKRMYGDNGCLLAVEINKRGVDLTVTNDFIHNRTHFYPVAR